MINRRFSISDTTFLYPRNDISLNTAPSAPDGLNSYKTEGLIFFKIEGQKKLRPHGERNFFLRGGASNSLPKLNYLPIKECIECIAHGEQQLVALKLHVG